MRKTAPGLVCWLVPLEMLAALACGKAGTGGQSFKPCVANTDCVGSESCFSTFPNGLCSRGCVTNADCQGADLCIDTGNGGVCTRPCTVNADCRSDLVCSRDGGACGGTDQSPQCIAFVDCFYRTGGTPGAFDKTYGPGGSCWNSGMSASTACTNYCFSELTSFENSHPDAGCN